MMGNSAAFPVQPVVFYLPFIHSAQSFQISSGFGFVHSVSSNYLLFDYSVLFSVLILVMYSRFFYPHINNQSWEQLPLSVGKAIVR
jgi:hypothetical protein